MGIYCDQAGAERKDGVECLIEDVGELRRLSSMDVEDEPLGRAVHIGPG